MNARTTSDEPTESPEIGTQAAPGEWHAEVQLSRSKRRELTGALTSLFVHLGLLLALALVVEIPAATRRGLVLLVERVTTGEALDDAGSLLTIAPPTPPDRALEAESPPAAESLTEQQLTAPRVPLPTSELPGAVSAASSPAHSGRFDQLAHLGAQAAVPLATMPSFDRRSLDGRRAGMRERLALARGGTPESEAAVERGLRWLAAHQLRDGSWNFNHDLVCRGACRNTGSAATTTGATGVALLAFLGAGYTQHEGPYQKTVRDGLYYLGNCSLNTPHGGDLQQGSMYGQGLATIALCEAYALSGDAALARVAEQAVEFILYAQDSQGGGWRYFPGQPGDTTVTGWQLMALKAGQLAELRISPGTIESARRFLDGVQAESGAFYGYQRPARGPTTTAVGLLCRMYLGWHREHPALARGANWLAETGPAADDMYFNYYASQVLSHYGGEPWQSWNPRMRDQLIATQAGSGHENGSWFFAGGQLVTGGRVVNTALAVMTLEVYYRYLPLYGDPAVDDGFE
ncbi:MAG: prenyltransferase/squalene oxidase repeat-containing protein [Pirellulales bacterium]